MPPAAVIAPGCALDHIALSGGFLHLSHERSPPCDSPPLTSRPGRRSALPRRNCCAGCWRASRSHARYRQSPSRKSCRPSSTSACASSASGKAPARCSRGSENQAMNTETKPPLPPFTEETAARKVRLAEDAWNTRDPDKVVQVYTEDTQWRNRAEFPQGREQVRAFLQRKWAKELDYRLIKELWACAGSRIAVRFAYEWHDDSGH